MWFSTEKIYICIYQKSKKKNLIDFKYRWMGFKTFYFYNKRWFYFNWIKSIKNSTYHDNNDENKDGKNFFIGQYDFKG